MDIAAPGAAAVPAVNGAAVIIVPIAPINPTITGLAPIMDQGIGARALITGRNKRCEDDAATLLFQYFYVK